MLVRKLPLELFAERRTFAHDLFGKQEVEGYLDNLDWAIGEQIAELGDGGNVRRVRTGRGGSAIASRSRAGSAARRRSTS